MKKMTQKLIFLVVSCLLLAPQLKAQDSTDPDDFTSYLKNPSFEFYYDNEGNEQVLDITTHSGLVNGALRGTPPGWEGDWNMGTMGQSYGINRAGRNKVGFNSFWAQRDGMPNHTLYQEVEGLPAGTYIVSCRLAPNSDHEITNQRLFANEKVQYYGKAEDHGSNLGDEDDADRTFAGWNKKPQNADGYLKPLFVIVEITEGEKLTLGIKTSALKADGTSATNAMGSFRVDDFQLRRYSEAPNDYTSKIINSSFELKLIPGVGDDSDVLAQIDAETVRGTPYGWSNEGTLVPNGGDPISFGVNNDANSMHGSVSAWVNSFPFQEEGFMLYQDIEDLPAGKYRVSCLMLIESNKVTTQRLFANNNVQYFGREDQYGDNLTDGEINTFAGLNFPTTNWSDGRNMQELSVEVIIGEGETLRLGAKTNNILPDGNQSSDSRGLIRIDDFRLTLIELTQSSDATLKEIKINGVELEGFSSEVLNYTYELEGDDFEVEATANDSKATVSPVSYPSEYPGNVTILVTAEDETTQTYTIAVTKIIKSSDATLKEIKINGVELEGFSAEELNYAYELDGDDLEIEATANDSKATVSPVSYPSEYPGNVTILVTAEDGTTQTYTIAVTKKEGVNIGSLNVAVKVYALNNVLVVEGIEDDARIDVYTIAGQQIKGVGLPDGVYIVKVAGSKTNFTQKLLVK